MPDLEEIKRFTETFDPYGDRLYPPDYIEWLIRAAERAGDAPPGWRTEILDLLEQHRGETGADEDALEVARRLNRAWAVVQALQGEIESVDSYECPMPETRKALAKLGESR